MKSEKLMQLLESALAHQEHLRELQEIIFKKFGTSIFSCNLRRSLTGTFRKCKGWRNGCKNLFLIARTFNIARAIYTFGVPIIDEILLGNY